jgi:hypothetical protein
VAPNALAFNEINTLVKEQKPMRLLLLPVACLVLGLVLLEAT